MIAIKNIHFSYKKKSVYSNLSIDFEQGHIYGLLGKNGTGKSTLFKNICGLLSPQSGTVNVMGYEAKERNPGMYSKLFLLPEDFFVPSVYLKDFVATLSPFYPHFSATEFENYLLDFEIPIKVRLDQMSLGQKKKALIAFSLSTNTDILLMDEPTNGLDILGKAQFKKVLMAQHKANKCIIISTHQIKDIENLVDSISIIDDGKVLLNTSVSEIGKKINFEIVDKISENSLYSEISALGIQQASPNETPNPSKVDLEMLFKAVMSNPVNVCKLFNQTKNEN